MAEVCPKTGFGAALMALPNRFVEALEVVEVEVVLPKAGGAVVGGAEVGAIEEEALLLLVIPPNPPNVGAADVGCEEDVVVVAMEPKEGVAEVIEDPNDGTVVLEFEDPPMVLPNVGAVAADVDDGVPKAKEVEPAPNAGTAAAGAGATLVFTGVAGTTAALVASLGTAVAAPPNENPTPASVVVVVVVAAAAAATTGFAAPKLNPPATAGADALVVAAVVAVGGLNALKPLDGPPKVIEVGVTCDVAEVVVAGAAVPKVKLDCEEVVAGLLVVAASGAGEKLIRFGVEAGGFVGGGAV